jgi:hypothetical protein
MFGIPPTLYIASIAIGATIVSRKYYSTTLVNDLNFTPEAVTIGHSLLI